MFQAVSVSISLRTMAGTPGIRPISEPQAPRRLLHDNLLCWGASAQGRSRRALLVDGQAYSYGELIDAARRMAGTLLRSGIRRGDRVAIYVDNSWPCVVSIYATLIAGGAFVLIHSQTKAEKLEFILKDCGARVLITDGHLAEIYRVALASLEHAPELICAGRHESSTESFDAAIGESRELAAAVPIISLDLAALIYTSGSTGTPKGVMHTHQSMMFAIGSLIEYLRLGPQERILCVLPLSFDYGLYQLLMSVTLGATLILEKSFTFPAHVYERVADEQVTVFPGVPTIFATLLAAHRRGRLSFPSVTRVTSTAAALPDEFTVGLGEVFPNALIFKMYGLTECKRVSYLEPELLEAKPGSVGRAIPGTEVYLLTAEGTPVPPGGTGILHVRGAHVMAGYWERPDLTEKMLRPGRLPGERVLCTQDLFRMDADGFLYFIGRTDDIIKTRGEKVSPVEVENALHRITGLREAAVIGVPHPVLGEAVLAFVVADPDAGLTERSIRAHSTALLENYMVPTAVVLCHSLPRGSNGKVDKQRLLAEAAPASLLEIL